MGDSITIEIANIEDEIWNVELGGCLLESEENLEKSE